MKARPGERQVQAPGECDDAGWCLRDRVRSAGSPDKGEDVASSASRRVDTRERGRSQKVRIQAPNEGFTWSKGG